MEINWPSIPPKLASILISISFIAKTEEKKEKAAAKKQKKSYIWQIYENWIA